jgi:hypothetical protein
MAEFAKVEGRAGLARSRPGGNRANLDYSMKPSSLSNIWRLQGQECRHYQFC